MKLTYLGTAAAEGIPAFFCKCRVCEYARKVKGKEWRTRSQALINDDLLIDYCPDTFAHLRDYDFFKLQDIENIIITHAHSDHLDTDDMLYIREGFAAVVDHKYNVYARKASCDRINNQFKIEGKTSRLQINEIEPYKTLKIGRYDVTPLKSNHSIYSDPVMYLIDDGKNVILYAHDTGIFPEETMEYLKNYKKHIDLLSLDCTGSLLTGWRDHHLSFDTFMEQVNNLKAIGRIDDTTKIVANHFSHNGGGTYAEMKEIFAKENVEVSYDGMVINL